MSHDNLPLVSVVVPTRNRVSLLPDLLAALGAQEYPCYELIVVDDASTDATPRMLSEWAGEDRVVLRLDNPFGSYAARNAGWRAARGEYVAFTDDDCLPTPAWISNLVAAWDERAVGVQGVTLAEPGEITPFTHQIEQRRPGPPYRTCNITYRRSILHALGGFDDTFRWYADNIFGLRAREHGAIAFAPDAIVRHPPRQREWRHRTHWVARFEADGRHRQVLRRLRAESVSPPRPLLPIILWVARPLAKQSLSHARYLLTHPREYVRNILPMLGEKGELISALREFYGPAPTPGHARQLQPLSPRPLVSVVVVTRDRPQFLHDALRALQRQTWEPREIVIVDHKGDLAVDSDLGRVEQAPDMTLGAARQVGVEAAHGDIVAFTDDDCVPDPTWLEELVQAFQRDPGLYGVQGRTRAGRGPVGSHAIQVSRPNSLFQTCNIAYRRDALQLAGGFDTTFQGWFEDTALGARIGALGPIGFASRAAVTHRAVRRQPLSQRAWRALLADERHLARCYPGFYRWNRGPHVVLTAIIRWLIGSPLKVLLRELPRSFSERRAYLSLVALLLRERVDLIRALRSSG